MAWERDGEAEEPTANRLQVSRGSSNGSSEPKFEEWKNTGATYESINL